jgi:hypothetical protein
MQALISKNVRRPLRNAVFSGKIEGFLHLLKNSPNGPVFNPWWQTDLENDFVPRAPQIRRALLRAYLSERIGRARLALVGEALGYRGGHFTGIPMTPERMLLKNPHLLGNITPRRTSRADRSPDGFAEPTASMVWNALLELGFPANGFVLWNAFPWHPFDPMSGLLSNRKPGAAELRSGVPIVERLLQMFRCETVIAIGSVATAQLESMGYRAIRVRHPANAGAAIFRRQLRDAVQRTPSRA